MMQAAFDFGETTPGLGLAGLQHRLREVFGAYRCDWRLTPVQQLIKSIISSRTLDRDSWTAFWTLWDRFGSVEAIAAASREEIEQAIAIVTRPVEKAAWVKTTLLQIRERRREFDLEFLGDGTVGEAMAWLQALPGVGPKVAAAVLNFSPLDRPVLAIDGHVHRVLQRAGLIDEGQGVSAGLRAIMARVPEAWTGEDLMELHVRLKRIGQTVCRPDEAHCGACPLAGRCAHATRLERRRAAGRDGAVALVSFS